MELWEIALIVLAGSASFFLVCTGIAVARMWRDL